MSEKEESPDVDETDDSLDAAFSDDNIPENDEPMAPDNPSVDPNPTQIQDDGKVDEV